MPAQRVVRRDGLCDRGRILRYPVVFRLPPIAIGPAVETTVADRGQVVRRCLVAEAVALVDHRPEYAGPWLPCHAHRVAQAARKDAACAISQIEFVDGSPAFLRGHAVLTDIAGRTDPDKELPAIGAQQQAPRPVPTRLEAGEFLSLCRDAVRARRIREGHHAVGVADIEPVSYTHLRAHET